MNINYIKDWKGDVIKFNIYVYVCIDILINLGMG